MSVRPSTASPWRHLFIAAVAAVALVACRSLDHRPSTAVPAKSFAPILEPVPPGQNLMLIIIDTMRVDRMSAYGYHLPTTPAVARIAGESIMFDRFYAAAPWTAPSFGTLLTGVSPRIHHTGKWLKNASKGVVRVGAVTMFPLNPQLQTLAGLLESHESAVFSSNPFLDPALGFARGVDYYDQTFTHRPANEITDAAISWLKENRDRDFFAMVHYMDAHTPYGPPKSTLRLFQKKKCDRVRSPFGPSAYEAHFFKPSAEEIECVTALYNAEVRFVDDQIDRLVNAMERLHILDNTWLVITADHGEEHWDHGDFNHGFQYEDEVTRVPLIIRAPGGQWGKGRRVPWSVPMQDLLPTFLEWFSIPPPDYLEGDSIMPLLRGEESADRPCYMEFQLFRRQRHAWFDGRYKFIKPETGRGAYMYDLATDPKEQKKIWGRHPEFQRLEQNLNAYRESRRSLIDMLNRQRKEHLPTESDTADDNSPPRGAALPAEAIQSLKALGYME